MKFDLIVGNPPYEGAGKPLYLQILDTLMPYAKEVVWICPSKWILNNEDSAWLSNMKKTTLNCLIEHEHIENPFKGQMEHHLQLLLVYITSEFLMNVKITNRYVENISIIQLYMIQS